MPSKLEKALRTQDKGKQNKRTELSGTMGVVLNGLQIVEVSNRAGFVYVMLNTKEQELIQAFNDKVSGAFGLAVIVVWNVNRYEVIRKDDLRYSTFNSNYIPKHGHQHSFDPDNGGGGDVAFIYGKQFFPLSLTPSGTYGGPVAVVAPYPQQYSGWHYIPSTPTPDITAHKPTDNQAKMVLVCMDWDTRAVQLIVGSTSFAANLTGSADVIPYLPATTGALQVPIAGVRLVSGTTAITWQNIYDVRQYFHPIFTGTVSGGGGGGGSSIDTIGFAGLDEGIPIGTGTFLNVVGAGATFTRSGTTFNLDIPGGGGSSVDTIGIAGLDEGIPVGTGTFLNVTGEATLTISGSMLNLNIPGGSQGPAGPAGTFGVMGWDEGTPLGTGTILNVTGQRATLSVSGTVLNMDISPDPAEIIGVYGLSNGIPLGTGTWIDFGDNLTATISGTILRVDAQAGGGGVSSVGVMGWDEGVPLGTGTVFNFVGEGITATRSGTVLNINVPSGSGARRLSDLADVLLTSLTDGDILIYDGTSGRWMNFQPLADAPFDNQVYGRQSGTWVRLTGTSSGGIGIGTISVYDDSVFVATGTEISFNKNLTVSATGTIVFVEAPVTTYFRVGVPVQLSGDFFQVPDRVYASGSLGVFNNGLALTVGVDYIEQLWVSGTYQYTSTRTGTHLVHYGIPCSPQTQPPTGTEGSLFDLADSSSVLLLDSNGIQLLDSNG